MKKLFIFSPLLFGAIAMHAQSVGPATMNAAGATGSVGGYEVEWSIGEMTMVSTFSNSSIVVTQGVLQPTTDKAGVDERTQIARQVQVFPNPAKAIVNVQYNAASAGTLSYRLTDMNGKTILKKKIDTRQGQNTDQFNIADLAVATYMLEVTVLSEQAVQSVISYKIDKLQ